MVGETRFELATPCTQNRCATRLRHSPTPGVSSVFAFPTQALFFKKMKFCGIRLPFRTRTARYRLSSMSRQAPSKITSRKL